MLMREALIHCRINDILANTSLSDITKSYLDILRAAQKETDINLASALYSLMDDKDLLPRSTVSWMTKTCFRAQQSHG